MTRIMANASSSLVFLLICTAVLLAATSPSIAMAGGNHHHLPESPFTTVKAPCNGTIAGCMEGEEFEMNSQTNRRMTTSKQKYVDYGAVGWNTIPCSRRGDSFNNCRSSAPANPYKRGCNPITGRRGG